MTKTTIPAMRRPSRNMRRRLGRTGGRMSIALSLRLATRFRGVYLLMASRPAGTHGGKAETERVDNVKTVEAHGLRRRAPRIGGLG